MATIFSKSLPWIKLFIDALFVTANSSSEILTSLVAISLVFLWISLSFSTNLEFNDLIWDWSKIKFWSFLIDAAFTNCSLFVEINRLLVAFADLQRSSHLSSHCFFVPIKLISCSCCVYYLLSWFFYYLSSITMRRIHYLAILLYKYYHILIVWCLQQLCLKDSKHQNKFFLPAIL